MSSSGWSQRVIKLTAYRLHHQATRLDNGWVLLTGGTMRISAQRKGVCDFEQPCSLSSTELVDSVASTSQVADLLCSPREAHGAALVAGSVIVAGGVVSGGACMRSLHTVDRSDRQGRGWKPIEPVESGIGQSLSCLADGRLLVAGGLLDEVTGRVELLDVNGFSWVSAAAMKRARYLHAAVVLGDGRVLVSGGLASQPDGALQVTTDAELYDPSTGEWHGTGSHLHERCEHTLTLLSDGRVLAAGGVGEGCDHPLSSAELWDPATGEWSSVPAMNSARVAHSASALRDGRVLIVGGMAVCGDGVKTSCTSAELFEPSEQRFASLDGPQTARWGHTATVLGAAEVMVAGGHDGVDSVDTAEIWRGPSDLSGEPKP